MEYRWLVGIIAVLALAACKTSSSAEMSDGPQAGPSSAVSASTSPEAHDTSFSAPALDGTPAAVGMMFHGGELLVSREDGSSTRWSASSESATTSAAVPGESVPLAWSPNGALAIIDGTPPVIIRIDDGKEVLRFVKVESVETAGFFPDGSGLFVGEPGGKLHVWNESVDTLTSVPTENLEAFIARQSPSFSANFSSLSGDATVTDANELLLGTKSGKLYWWNPEDPTQVKPVVKLPGAIRDTAYAGGKVFATTDAGAFRAAETSNGVFLQWSNDMNADYVAAAARAPAQVLVADDSSVRMLDANEGTQVWHRTLPNDSNVCGLAISADGQTGAVCLNGSVVVFDADGDVLDTMP
ncbi:MAG: PQQ-binding-like beta-propeller repeat protein [Myxococcota bacterium]